MIREEGAAIILPCNILTPLRVAERPFGCAETASGRGED